VDVAPCIVLPECELQDCQLSSGATPAGFPQEGVDAALADFSRLAGDANAALLRDYVAAVLGRHPQPQTADPTASAGAAAVSEPAAATAQPAAAAVDVGSAAPAAGATAPAEEATAGAVAGAAGAATTAAGDASAARDSGPGRGRPPRHVVLQPIADKHARGAVHGFFKAEPRLPPMRTETFQSTVKEGSNTVRTWRHR
jgi:septal ring-binding cell division protein DamX